MSSSYTRGREHSMKRAVQAGFTLIELVVVIVILGILVLILALGVFLPIWDMGKVMLMKK